MGLTHFNGLCVTGSGLYAGAKNSEVAIVANTPTPLFDSSSTGISGHVMGIATRCTSVGMAWATNTGALPEAHSGIILNMNWSGGAIDIYRYAVNGSAATSGSVAWGVWGAK